jgi:hypothetical protein
VAAAAPTEKATASGRAGSAGPKWASAGLLAGSAEMRVGPSGSDQKGRFRFLFFLNIFNDNKFQKKTRKCFKARKILKKSQNFQ